VTQALRMEFTSVYVGLQNVGSLRTAVVRSEVGRHDPEL
jgi:hypothetical protein